MRIIEVCEVCPSVDTYLIAGQDLVIQVEDAIEVQDTRIDSTLLVGLDISLVTSAQSTSEDLGLVMTHEVAIV